MAKRRPKAAEQQEQQTPVQSDEIDDQQQIAEDTATKLESELDGGVGYNPPPTGEMLNKPAPPPPPPIAPEVSNAIAAAVAQAMKAVVPSLSQIVKDAAKLAGRKEPKMHTDARGAGERPTMVRQIPVYANITLHDALNFLWADKLLLTDKIPFGDALERAFTVLSRSGIRRGLAIKQGDEDKEKPEVESVEQKEINKQFGEYLLALLEEPLPAPMPLAPDNIGFDGAGAHYWRFGEGYVFRNDAVVVAPRKLGDEPKRSVIPDLVSGTDAMSGAGAMNERDATIERRF